MLRVSITLECLMGEFRLEHKRGVDLMNQTVSGLILLSGFIPTWIVLIANNAAIPISFAFT